MPHASPDARARGPLAARPVPGDAWGVVEHGDKRAVRVGRLARRGHRTPAGRGRAVVLVLAVVGAGCRDDAVESSTDGLPPPPPAMATGSAAEDAPRAVVEVLAPGTGPAIAWPTGEGAERTLVLTAALSLGDDGSAVPLRIVVAAERAPSDDDAYVFAVRTVETLAPVEGNARRRIVRHLRRIASEVGRFDPRGRTVTFDDAEDDPARAAVRAVLGRALPFLDPPHPGAEVRMGMRWRTRVREQETGFEVVRGATGGPAVRVVVGAPDGRDALAVHVRPEAPDQAESDRLSYEGTPQSGAVLFARTLPGARVRVGPRRMPVADDGRFLVGLGRTPRIPTLVTIEFSDGTSLVHALAPVRREFDEERIDGLPAGVVEPPRRVRKRLAEINKKIDAVRRRATPVAYFDDGFVWPARGRITSTYGRKRILNGKDKGFHWGVDIGAPIGRPVVAPAAGEVVFVHGDVPLAGKVVIIDHGLGLSSSFLHLSRIHVRPGQKVAQGERIGRVGRTGRATGPHLDWRMNVLDVRVDPMLLVEGTPDGP